MCGSLCSHMPLFFNAQFIWSHLHSKNEDIHSFWLLADRACVYITTMSGLRSNKQNIYKDCDFFQDHL